MAKRRTKFGNIVTSVDGRRFDSQKEAKRYVELKLLEKAGEISSLRMQVPFKLDVGSANIGKYYADFVYTLDGKEVVEDVKGFRTAMYKWKKKHVEAQYGIQIKET